MKLTRENLHALATGGCGFNNAQAKLLGVKMKKGWLSGLIGQEIPDDVYRAAMALKGATAQVSKAAKKPRNTAQPGQHWPKPVRLNPAPAIGHNAADRDNATRLFLVNYLVPGKRVGSGFDEMLKAYKRTDRDRVADYAERLPYRTFLQTSYWWHIAEEVKRLAGHRCAVCASPANLQAHHRRYKCRGREIEQYREELTCLCQACHSRHHGVKSS